MTLKERRLSVGLTQEDLARKMNVDQSAVSLWENGVNGLYRKNHKKLAKILHCSVLELIESIEETRLLRSQ